MVVTRPSICVSAGGDGGDGDGDGGVCLCCSTSTGDIQVLSGLTGLTHLDLLGCEQLTGEWHIRPVGLLVNE